MGTVLSYIFYWLCAIVVLIYLKFKEGRTNLFGYESAAGSRRREIKMNENEKVAAAAADKSSIEKHSSSDIDDTPQLRSTAGGITIVEVHNDV